MRSHPYLLYLCSFSWPQLELFLIIVPAGFWLSLLYPNFYLDSWWIRLQLARGNAVCERTNCSNSGRASHLNAGSRERFTPAAVADVVTPRTPSERLWPHHTCYDSLLLPLGRSVSCTAFPPYQPPADESGGWWSATPASTPVPPSLRLPERSRTEPLGK